MKQATIVHEWEEYRNGPNEPMGERLHVTLNARGMLLLNRKVFEAMGRPKAAMLLFDQRNQTIGVRAAGPADQKPFPIKPHPKGSHRGIQARPFCRHYNILPPEPIRFTDPTLDHDSILILSLHQTEPVQSKKRKPPTQTTTA